MDFIGLYTSISLGILLCVSHYSDCQHSIHLFSVRSVEHHKKAEEFFLVLCFSQCSSCLIRLVIHPVSLNYMTH